MQIAPNKPGTNQRIHGSRLLAVMIITLLAQKHDAARMVNLQFTAKLVLNVGDVVHYSRGLGLELPPGVWELIRLLDFFSWDGYLESAQEIVVVLNQRNP